jgi:hypothetical protein
LKSANLRPGPAKKVPPSDEVPHQEEIPGRLSTAVLAPRQKRQQTAKPSARRNEADLREKSPVRFILCPPVNQAITENQLIFLY